MIKKHVALLVFIFVLLSSISIVSATDSIDITTRTSEATQATTPDVPEHMIGGQLDTIYNEAKTGNNELIQSENKETSFDNSINKKQSIYTEKNKTSGLSQQSYSDKLNTYITMEDIESVKLLENIAITGKLTDENGNALSNKVIRLFINDYGGSKALKTDANGVYLCNYTLHRAGLNNFTAKFEGNDNYKESSATTSVLSKPYSTQIKLNYGKFRTGSVNRYGEQ